MIEPFALGMASAFLIRVGTVKMLRWPATSSI